MGKAGGTCGHESFVLGVRLPKKGKARGGGGRIEMSKKRMPRPPRGGGDLYGGGN